MAKKAVNNAYLFNLESFIAAGIDPKTGFPTRSTGSLCNISDNIKLQLTREDTTEAVSRYTWYNLPKGINAQLVERILYTRGSGMLFMLEGKFYFLPYVAVAPDSGIGRDCYGRPTCVSPLPYNGGVADEENEPWIRGLTFEPVYDPIDINDYLDKSPEEIVREIEGKCVIIHDYTPMYNEQIIPRAIANQPLIEMMAELPAFMRTALLNSTGIMGLRVGNENEQAEVDRLSEAINQCALHGRKYTGIVGTADFQEMTGGNVAKAEEFMIALQSLDNFRLGTYGLNNSGLYTKKAHMLESEQNANAGSTGLIMEDGLRNRQYSSTIATSIFGIPMWCEPSETVLGVDRDGDMIAGSDGEAATAKKQASKQEVATDDE